MAKPQDYLKIVKRLLYNLKKNHKLRGAVVRSYLPAHALVIMEPSELATDEARRVPSMRPWSTTRGRADRTGNRPTQR